MKKGNKKEKKKMITKTINYEQRKKVKRNVTRKKKTIKKKTRIKEKL